MLFGDDMTPAGYAGWVTAAVLLLGAVVKGVIDISGDRQKRRLEDRRDSLDEAMVLLDRQKQDIGELKLELVDCRREAVNLRKEFEEEIGKVRDRESQCERRLERMTERMLHYEEVLRDKEIKFTPWTASGPPSGTDLHKPLPGGPTE